MDKKAVMLIPLILILVIVWVIVLKPPASGKSHVKIVKKEEIKDEANDIEQLKEMLNEVNINKNLFHYSFSKRDPMKPNIGKKSILAKNIGEQIETTENFSPLFILKGIVFVDKNQSSPLAVINKDIVKEGSEINGGKVISIKKNKVYIEWRGEKKWIFLNPQVAKGI